MAEALISGATFAYLQRTNTLLLEGATGSMQPEAGLRWHEYEGSPRLLWSALAILMMLKVVLPDS
jgi:hypothetical protein